MSFFKKEERNASDKQIKGIAQTFIGILVYQNKLNLDMSDKETKKDAVQLTIDSIREWEKENNLALTHSDATVIFNMSYIRNINGKRTYCYEDNAGVIAEIEKKMLNKLTAFDTSEPKKKTSEKPAAKVKTKAKTKGSSTASMKVRDNEELLDACAEKGIDEDEFLKLMAIASKST